MLGRNAGGANGDVTSQDVVPGYGYFGELIRARIAGARQHSWKFGPHREGSDWLWR